MKELCKNCLLSISTVLDAVCRTFAIGFATWNRMSFACGRRRRLDPVRVVSRPGGQKRALGSALENSIQPQRYMRIVHNVIPTGQDMYLDALAQPETPRRMQTSFSGQARGCDPRIAPKLPTDDTLATMGTRHRIALGCRSPQPGASIPAIHVV